MARTLANLPRSHSYPFVPNTSRLRLSRLGHGNRKTTCRCLSIATFLNARPRAAVDLHWSMSIGGRIRIARGHPLAGRVEGRNSEVHCHFDGYEESDDPFDIARFVAHEMLHTFGYHHGDEMYHLQKLVKVGVLALSLVHGRSSRSSANDCARLSAVAVEKKPAVKKKAGHKKK